MVRERRNPVTKAVRIQVTDEETVRMARKIGELSTEKALIQAEAARSKSAFKGKIETKDTEIAELLKGINDGMTTETLEVVEVFDFEAGQIETEHDGQVIDVRNMTGEERQMGLKLAPPAQGDLPLASVHEIARPPTLLGEPEAFQTTLPNPEDCPNGEAFVTGDPVRPTLVRYLAVCWKLEIGEGAMFKVIESDAFGTTIKTWEKATSLAPAAIQEPQPTEETAQ